MPQKKMSLPTRAPSLGSLPKRALKQRLAMLQKHNSTTAQTQQDNATHDLQVYQVELEMQNRALRDAQMQLEASLRRYSDLFESAPVGYCILDVDGRLRAINRSAAEMLSVSGQPDKNLSLAECVTLQDRAAVARHLKNSLREGGEPPLDVRAINHTGKVSHLNLISVPEYDAANTLRGFKVALTDISERKAMEARLYLTGHATEALQSSLNYAESLSAMLAQLQASFAELCFVDLVLNDRSALRIHSAVLGSAEEAVYAAKSEALFPQGQAQTPQMQVLKSEQPMYTEKLVYDHKSVAPEVCSGSRSMLVVPLLAHEKILGTLTCLARPEHTYTVEDLAAALDIAHRSAMAVHSGVLHERVQEAVHARQMILATVSHDLKNVLTSIKMRGEILLENTDKAVSKQGSAIDRLVNRMHKMLDDLMDIASIECGQLRMQPGPHRDHILVAEAIDTYLPSAEARNIQIEADTSNLLLYCDPERFLQVLGNLLSNAIKFSSDGGRVVVSTKQDVDCVRIGVKDHGPGIAPESLNCVFNQYWQAPEGRAKGRGLGLAISQGIVKASNGRIWVESQLGAGSTFNFTLPAARDMQLPGDGTHNSRTVLVVEDDDDLRLAACEILRKANYSVQGARNGQEALHLSKIKPPPSLILLDLEMPICSGWEFLRQRTSDPFLREIKVVVMSGISAAREQVEKRGARFLSKPIRAQQLLDSVRAELQY